MGAVIVVILLALLCGGAFAVFYINKTKGKTTAEVPACTMSIPTPPPASGPWGALETIPNTDDFVPQETIYTYYNPTPGISCPVCDAENPSGTSYCQVCGAILRSAKYF